MPAEPARGSAGQALAMTISQANAIQAAERYLAMSAFSRSGLIQQLSSRYETLLDPGHSGHRRVEQERIPLIEAHAAVTTAISTTRSAESVRSVGAAWQG